MAQGINQNIVLSRNELWALLTKVFEALYGHRRDYYDMARTALWLECHGHNGVERLVYALPALEQIGLPKPELTEVSHTHSVLDGQRRSLFCLGRTAIDLAIAEAAEHKISEIEIKNSTDPESLIGLMPYAAKQGFAILLAYGETEALIGPSADHPVIFKRENSQSIRITCGPSEGVLKQYVSKGLTPSMKAKTQADSFKAVLEKGLKIDRAHFDILSKVADRVLVEASEASRRGAGE